MKNQPIPSWLVDFKHGFLADEDSLSINIRYLGECRIDTHREFGDLYKNWDIKTAESGEIPNAGYGANPPKPCELGYFPIMKMWEINTLKDVNGWEEKETLIYSNDGELLAFRRY